MIVGGPAGAGCSRTWGRGGGGTGAGCRLQPARPPSQTRPTRLPLVSSLCLSVMIVSSLVVLAQGAKGMPRRARAAVPPAAAPGRDCVGRAPATGRQRTLTMSEYKNVLSHFESSYHFDNDAPLALVMPRRASGADRRRLATAVGGGGATCAYKRPSSWVVIGVRGDRALGTST